MSTTMGQCLNPRTAGKTAWALLAIIIGAMIGGGAIGMFLLGRMNRTVIDIGFAKDFDVKFYNNHVDQVRVYPANTTIGIGSLNFDYMSMSEEVVKFCRENNIDSFAELSAFTGENDETFIKMQEGTWITFVVTEKQAEMGRCARCMGCPWRWGGAWYDLTGCFRH